MRIENERKLRLSAKPLSCIFRIRLSHAPSIMGRPVQIFNGSNPFAKFGHIHSRSWKRRPGKDAGKLRPRQKASWYEGAGAEDPGKRSGAGFVRVNVPAEHVLGGEGGK